MDDSSNPKRFKTGDEVIICDAMDVKQDSTEDLIDSVKADMDVKGKAKISYNEDWEDHVKDAPACDLKNSDFIAGSMDIIDPIKSSMSGSVNSNNVNSSNSDLSYHDEEGLDEGCDDYADDVSDYGDNDDFLYEDDYEIMQSHFDNVDLPPGVEASIPWLKDPAPTGKLSSVPGTSIPESAENKKENLVALADGKLETAPTSSSSMPTESKSAEKDVDEVMLKFKNFKQFDIVDNFSDHHYNSLASSGEKQTKEWAKRITEEWKILEDLPDTIFVRVCESRMDLLRAIIIGPSGTPYHDGLFVFDCLFPPKYPNEPPMVYYYSGGLRLNPNLYNCGKVCLSLLGTWHGNNTEMWVPGQSTMLQVLVSIQALILNAKPFFNEPGFDSSYPGAEGEKKSNHYNEEVFILSLKTMIYTLRRPPEHFQDFVVGHFRSQAHDILVACSAYANGALPGSVVVKNGVADVNKTGKSSAYAFRSSLAKVMKLLARDFVKNGSTDCEKFQTARS
ncbi:hypothetical protein SLE2022_050070 [Rubroshorea leprosula]